MIRIPKRTRCATQEKSNSSSGRWANKKQKAKRLKREKE